MTGLSQFRLSRSGTDKKFRAAFFIVTASSVRAVDFEDDLADAVMVFTQLGFDGVSATGAVGMLGLEDLHFLRASVHFLTQRVQLRFDLGALAFERDEFARQNQPKLGAHFFAQPGIALSFRSLPLERIHLARNFLEDVVHARQVELRVFETGFGQALLGLEFRDASRFFEDGAAIGGTAAEDLPNTSLFNQGIGFRS